MHFFENVSFTCLFVLQLQIYKFISGAEFSQKYMKLLRIQRSNSHAWVKALCGARVRDGPFTQTIFRGVENERLRGVSADFEPEAIETHLPQTNDS